MKKSPVVVGCVFIAAGALVLAAPIAFSQTPASSQASQPPLSPRGSAKLTLDGYTIEVDYGRPYRRGRKIMGSLVPYGEVWRTGANATTGFSTEADLEMGGALIPKGKYTIYTLPSEQTWKLIINKRTGQSGMMTDYSPSEDLVRLDLQKQTLPETIEQFTMTLEQTARGAAVMKLAWEHTLLSIPFRLAR